MLVHGERLERLGGCKRRPSCCASLLDLPPALLARFADLAARADYCISGIGMWMLWMLVDLPRQCHKGGMRDGAPWDL